MNKNNTSFKNRILLGVAFIGLVAMFPKNSYAQSDTGVILNAISNSATQVEQNTTQGLTSVQTVLDNDLRNLSGQNTVNNNGQTTAMSNIAGTQDTRNVIMATEATKLQAEEGATSGISDCNVTTGIAAGQSIPNIVAAWREQLTQASLEYENGDITDSATTAPSDSYQTLVARESNHCKNFSTAYDVSIGLCPSGTSGTNKGNQQTIVASINGSGLTGTSVTNPNNSTALNASVGSDLNAGNIIDNTTLSPYQVTAANQWLANMLGASPMGALPAGYAKTPANVALVAQDETDLSRHSVIESVAANIIADKVPLSSSGVTASDTTSGSGITSGSGTATFSTSLQQWAEGTAAQVLGYQKSSAQTYFPDGVSNQAQMELRAKSWFFNPTWQLGIDGQVTDAPLLKDLDMMTAYNVYQNYMLYREQEQTNLLLATIAAKLTDKQ
jgi:hypothetical protein